MFTGIVEDVGSIGSIEQNGSSLVLQIKAKFASELTLGESVAVNGICLTVTKKDDASFSADVTPETFRRTSLSLLSAGSPVNLERAMRADGRFGGHIVSGHIDGTGRLTAIRREDNAYNVFFRVEKPLFRYIIEKGSVALDGISLTVASVKNEGNYGEFSVAVIPHTWENTALKNKRVGSIINVECDVVGKYIEHFVSFGKEETKQTEIDMTNFPSFHR
ncbi:riboflavin synthase [Treponema saccharophilum]|uniref:Riboflavin synthase n=1 Tax=Treponema saccharophilum DSM 2985 TaxID=907348 RepID=H7EN16_9SPIR|nr:riboflavin synthase [Treponema saccharophilum]EIC01080.1 riboflavin synthase, alpha subunit [Treponema saccharophilum DSM 2985]BDC95392.1 riboflavin synthase subunit alpha [Treponema saccharophilum]